MTVRKLIEVLSKCDPDAFVTIDLPISTPEYLGKIQSTPADHLWFLVDEKEVERSNDPMPQSEVVIMASIDGSFTDPLNEYEPDMETVDACFRETAIPPDFDPTR